jgi:hypothetical protein
MTTVAAGATGTYTFTATSDVFVDLAANERALVEVRRNGNVIFSDRLTSSKVIGTFLTGDGMRITADGPAIDYTVLAQNLSVPRSGIIDTLDADLPSASVDNLGQLYFVTDEAGGTLRKSSGTSMVKLAPGVTEANTGSSTWAERGTAAVNTTKIFTDVGNLGIVEGIYDGARWQPRGGKQLLYSLKAPLTGAGTTSYVVTLPSITIPGGLMGINGELVIEMEAQGSTTPIAATPSITFDGYELAGNGFGANRRLWLGRRIRNENSASVQTVYAHAGSTGSFESANNDHRGTTKNTANDLVLTGSMTWTHASSITGVVGELKVWWVAG